MSGGERMLRMEIALIIILGFIAYMYYSAERKHTKLHRTFSVLLLVVIVHLVFDAVTILYGKSFGAGANRSKRCISPGVCRNDDRCLVLVLPVHCCCCGGRDQEKNDF